LQVFAAYFNAFQIISGNFTMPNIQPQASADVVSLDAVRQRRHHIDLANADPEWQQAKAPFASEGIELTDDNAEQAGRMIAGHATYAHVLQEIRARYDER
jgi:hypothetical protein